MNDLLNVSTCELPERWAEHVEISRNTRESAYAPYSSYKVGASVQTEGGLFLSGCNVENASYGLTMCAERVAVCSAVALGLRDFPSLCLSATGIVAPCGACRQFLYEFNPDMLIILDDVGRDPITPPVCISLRELLPGAFRLEDEQTA